MLRYLFSFVRGTESALIHRNSENMEIRIKYVEVLRLKV